MLLIGSRARRLLANSSDMSGCRDWDFIATNEAAQAWARRTKPRSFVPVMDGKKYVAVDGLNDIIEIEIAWPGTTAKQLWNMVKGNSFNIEILGFGNVTYPELDVLYTLKMSHRYLRNSPHFLKTMADIQEMRREGAAIPNYLNEWYVARQKETYFYKHPNLNQDKTGFFNGDGVTYVYDHDSIHRAIARGKQPAYEYFKDDLSEVKVSKPKWVGLDHQTKLNAVVEEATVLALERSQIPYRGQADPFWSFRTALIKVCSSITSGWFREFSWEHFDETINLYTPDYVNNFWKAVDEGRVIKLAPVDQQKSQDT